MVTATIRARPLPTAAPRTAELTITIATVVFDLIHTSNFVLRKCLLKMFIWRPHSSAGDLFPLQGMFANYFYKICLLLLLDAVRSDVNPWVQKNVQGPKLQKKSNCVKWLERDKTGFKNPNWSVQILKLYVCGLVWWKMFVMRLSGLNNWNEFNYFNVSIKNTSTAF